MSQGLAEQAPQLALTIAGAVRREYPNAPQYVLTGPGEIVSPRTVHPAFYGCFDWHSAVAMHWALLRLLPHLDGPERGRAEQLLDEHLTPANLRAETDHLVAHPAFERPYGWGWALALADAAGSTRWADAVRPLADRVTDGLLRWLPASPRPNRQGTHGNTAFALSRSWGWAQRLASDGDPSLLDAITLAARRWYGNDRDCPAEWEPGATDFLSPTLAEAELMGQVLPPPVFRSWLEIALPGLAEGHPACLFRPITGIDSSDGQAAHLDGLNLHRAAGFRAVQVATGDSLVLQRAVQDHLDAGLREASGGHWMVEHWLAAYAVLALEG